MQDSVHRERTALSLIEFLKGKGTEIKQKAEENALTEGKYSDEEKRRKKGTSPARFSGGGKRGRESS